MPETEYILAVITLPLQNHSTLIEGSPTGATLASKWAFSPSMIMRSFKGVMNEGGP